MWVEILRYLDVGTLWHSTRPVSKLLHHVSSQYIKSALTDGGTCQLRHFVSSSDDFLIEKLEYPREPSDYHRRLLEQEGDTPLHQIVLWTSPTPTRANPQIRPGIPTLKYIFADGRKCCTLPAFGFRESPFSRSGYERTFHCGRQGCRLSMEESVSDGHVCICGCWHIHYLQSEKRFTVTIPLAILMSIYLRLNMAERKNISSGFQIVVKNEPVRTRLVTTNFFL